VLKRNLLIRHTDIDDNSYLIGSATAHVEKHRAESFNVQTAEVSSTLIAEINVEFTAEIQFDTILDITFVSSISATSSSGYDEQVAEIPPPPNFPSGAKEVACPYCFEMLLFKDVHGS